HPFSLIQGGAQPADVHSFPEALSFGRASTATNGLSFSNVFGPTPLIRRSSPTDANGFSARAATIASANLGPMPGTRSKSSTVARLRSSGASPLVSFLPVAVGLDEAL